MADTYVCQPGRIRRPAMGKEAADGRRGLLHEVPREA